jgi:hypothetical protein
MVLIGRPADEVTTPGCAAAGHQRFDHWLGDLADAKGLTGIDSVTRIARKGTFLRL